jgi:hypothetical protein
MVLVGGCYSLDELCARVGSGVNMTAWLLYLGMREEEEAARIKAMFEREG